MFPYLGPNSGGGNEDNGALLQKVPCTHCHTQCPQPRNRPLPTHISAGDSRTLMGKSGSVSCGVSAPFSWCTQGSFCAFQESVSPVLCKFWELTGGVNGDLLHEGLCRSQACCTQSPCPCGRPLLTSASTQTWLRLSLCGVSGSWCAQALFEPSECLERVQGLIVNMISLLLPSCWGFSFGLGCGVSPQSCSCAAQPHEKWDWNNLSEINLHQK